VVGGEAVNYLQVELVQVRTFLWVPTLAAAGVVAFFGFLASHDPEVIR
jgi:hypothetical protein